MAAQNGNGRQKIINDLISYAKDRVPKTQFELLEQFAHRYYTSASYEDLNSHSIEDLFGALLSHWNFIYQRKLGESKVRIFNPTKEKDGYESLHTIIEVSHDDIPFL
ncbi:MAG: hypothetical protein JO131_04850, partial [Gammaproteobacteria bacterium]|nr:hypothetical protein [Gammaproteobacteria bacterium]